VDYGVSADYYTHFRCRHLNEGTSILVSFIRPCEGKFWPGGTFLLFVVVEKSLISRFCCVKFTVQWSSGADSDGFCVHHVFETPRVDHNFIDDLLEVEISEGRGYNSVLLDSYRRLADFDVLNFRSNGAVGQIFGICKLPPSSSGATRGS